MGSMTMLWPMLRIDPEETLLSYADRLSMLHTGRGMESAAFERPGVNSTGFGLMSVRERLRQVGGDLHIDSAPNEGMQITLRVPLPSR